jgi:hypothetical protein
LPDLQRPICLPAIQRKDSIYGDMIGIRDCEQSLIRLHFMDDLAIGIGCLGHDQTDRSGCGEAGCVFIRDK